MRSASSKSIFKADTLVTARALLIALSLTTGIIGVYHSRPVSSKGIELGKATTSPPVRSQSDIRPAGPGASRAVGFAESIPVRQMAGMAGRPPLATKGQKASKKSYQEAFSSSKLIGLSYQKGDAAEAPKTGDPHQAVNSVVARSSNVTPSVGGSTLSPSTLPTPSVNFEGISVYDTVPLGQGFLPPDTTGEAGPNHYVQAVNVAFRVWDKQGVPLTPPISLGELFSTLPGSCSASLGGSPNVIYDQLADRWLITQRCTSNLPGRDLIAVSKTGDPTGAYYLFEFQTPNFQHIDSPKLGVWPDGYYMSIHQFEKTGNFFRGAGFFAFDRAKMLAGDPTAGFIYFNSCPDFLNCTVVGAYPSDLDGLIPPPTGSPNVFALFTADEYNDPEGDGLRLFDFHADFAVPENSTFTERIGSPLTVAPFNPIIPPIAQPNLDYFTNLDPQSGRLMYRLAYRNFGSGLETLVTTHTVDTGVDYHAGVRYYQLNRTDPSGPFTVGEQQTFAPDQTNRWMASGAMNFMGDTAVGYSVSSETVFPSIRYAARLATDPAGTGLAQGEQTIVDGGGSQYSSTRRWGDYSDMTVDPADDCSFWYTQEYYASNNTNGWQTRIAKFAPRDCTTSPRGNIRGTVTSCATGLSLANVSLSASGGFERLTDPAGTFEFVVTPGTYTISPTKLGYSAQPVGGLLIENGSQVTQNFCMAPIPSLRSPGPTVVTDNHMIEPNECNYLNIPLENIGANTASDVSATLSTTTPGVTIAQPTSGYPDILQNSGLQTNNASYLIITDGSIGCLTSIDLKLTVTYAGGNSPTVFDFSLTGRPTYRS